VRSALSARFGYCRWRFPEYWAIAASVCAWGYFAMPRTAHVHHASMAAAMADDGLMVVAMMVPLQVRAMRLIAEHSLWSRRDRAVAVYIAGYVGAWVALLTPLAWASVTFHDLHTLDPVAGAAIGAIVTAAWLVSPWKATAARRCHRAARLAPSGWRADLDCLRYGFVSGCRCAGNCWPLMIACWLSGHSLAVMLAAFGLGWIDRHFAPDERTHGVLLAGMASALGLYAFVR
jgi:hypothetical protein